MRKLLWLFLLAASLVQAAPALVQSKEANVGATNSLTVTYTSSVTATHDLILAVASTISTAPTITEGSETVHTDVSWGGNSNGVYLGIYHVENTVGGTITWSSSFGSNGQIVLLAFDYSGLATSNAFDAKSPIAVGSTLYPTTASVTPSQSGDLAIGLVSQTTTTIASWSNGFTQELTGAQGAGVHGTYADQTLSGSSSIAMYATANASDSWACVTALYKASGSGPPVTSNSALMFLSLNQRTRK